MQIIYVLNLLLLGLALVFRRNRGQLKTCLRVGYFQTPGKVKLHYLEKQLALNTDEYFFSFLEHPLSYI